MHLQRHAVGDRTSVDSVFTPGQRRGLYILEFDDGQRYVGLTTDVVRRFSAHRRRWSDIAAINFAAEPTADLPPLEHALIQQQQQAGHVLRNKAFALGPPGPSPLDVVVTPSQQDAWLAASDDDLETADLGDGPCHVTDTARAQGRPAWERLLDRPDAGLAVDLLSSFVHAVIPRPRETEGRFWGVSAAPSTGSSPTWHRLAALSVHSMETFVIGETPLLGRDDDWMVRGFVVVSRSALEEHSGRLFEDLAVEYTPLLGFSQRRYESAGDDDVSIHWSGTEESFAALGELPWIDAARALTIRLMRKGLSLQRRWHNVPLADAVFAGRSTPPDQ